MGTVGMVVMSAFNPLRTFGEGLPRLLFFPRGQQR
jgi:hypothetical protein